MPLSGYYYPPKRPEDTTICICCCDDLITKSQPSRETNSGAASGGGARAVGPSIGRKSVVLSSGQFTFRLPLLSIDAFGIAGWRFSLEYLSDSGIDGLLGPNFDFTQYARLMLDGDDVLLATDQNTVEVFEYDNGSYSSVNNNTAGVLRPDGEGHFELLASNGTVTIFYGFDGQSTPGRIKQIKDRYGNTQEFSWTNDNGVDQLDSVTDGYGRKIEYRYYGAEHDYQLQEIEDFLGRKLNFQYDSEGRLVAVVTPSITKGAEGNTFPGGTAYVFQYDSGNSRPDRRNDLIRIWYPNEVAPFLDVEARSVNVSAVYAQPTRRYFVEYGQDPASEDQYGRVLHETVGQYGTGPGGKYDFAYTTDPLLLPANLIDPNDPIVSRTMMTDRNGNDTYYDFNITGQVVRKEVFANRHKLSVPHHPLPSSYVTWTKYNAHNQPVLVVFPEGNSVEYEYEDGNVGGTVGTYAKRIGLLVRETFRPGNTMGIPSRLGSNGQTELTRRYFYDPIYNQRCAVIERRGNPVDRNSATVYWTPQNLGPAASDSDRSRYATFTTFDYQQNTLDTIKGDTGLQAMLDLSAGQIAELVASVDGQMKAAGLPGGFPVDLGDINGDGTGNGASSGKPAAAMVGNVVKVEHPRIRQLVPNDSGDPWKWQKLPGETIVAPDEQAPARVELFTNNLRGQVTTHTDPEGNITVYVRYPYNDPEGDGRFVSDLPPFKQYGRLKEVHVDVDPDDVMSLVGVDGDLVEFRTDVYPRSDRQNTPDEHLDLVTRYQGTPTGGGCAACGYDALGNVLSETGPRGFTTVYDRNELGEAWRVTSPAPYEYRTETYYDANRNVIREDVEDKVVAFASDDPTDANYAKFLPTGSGTTAHVPTKAGPGGTDRPGWFSNYYTYDLLDNRISESIDATGSYPDRLVTTYEYDSNRNLIRVTKPEGNTVEYDYDERNLQIATRIGYVDAAEPGALTITVYDGNGNVIDQIGATDRLGGAGPTTLTAVIDDAFRLSDPITHIGTWDVQNTYDGFDRVTEMKDAIGNVTEFTHDPDGRVVETVQQGPARGASPSDREGDANVDLARSETRYNEAGAAFEQEQAVFLNTGKSGDDPIHTLPSGRDVDHTGGGLKSNSTTNDHTDTVTLTATPTESSYVLSRTAIDRAQRMMVSATDNGAVTTFDYDGAGRQIKMTYPTVTRGGSAREVGFVETTYDANGNAVYTRSVEKPAIDDPPAGIATSEFFASYSYYDALNRLVATAGQGADGTLNDRLDETCPWPPATETLVTRIGYDSRSNQTLSIDAKGNTTITVYDGASRPVESIQHLRQNGGGGDPLPGGTFLADGGSSIRTQTFYDGNGRVTQLVDDRGGTTLYAYDTLDRQVTMTFHDGSQRSTEYDAAGDVIEYIDENGSVFTSTYDAAGRLVLMAIAPASGVAGHNGGGTRGTTAQGFQYDGLGRRTHATDVTTVDAGSTWTSTSNAYFDSLGRVVEEQQEHDFDGAGNEKDRQVTQTAFTSLAASEFTYASGRAVTYVHDEMYRRAEIIESASIAKWSFWGPARVAELFLGNGLICTHLNNTRTNSAVQSPDVPNPGWGGRADDRLGYDGSGRMITKRYLDATATSSGYTDGATPTEAFVGFTTAFDRSSNKLYERHLHAVRRSHRYTWHDSLNRLRGYERGTLASGGGSVTDAINVPNTDTQRTYDLDGLGNWRRTVFTPEGGSETTQVRQHNYVNQTTEMGATAVTYDHGDNDDGRAGNGNVADDGTRLYQWDALNRLTAVTRKSDSQPIAAYRYDGLGRRIRRMVTNGGLPGTLTNGTTDFVYLGVQCVEERDDSDIVLRQYVWGRYVDELIQQKEKATPDVDYYLLSDLLYRSLALTDTSKTIHEAYDCDAYGRTLLFSDGGGSGWFSYDDVQALTSLCRFIFTGRSHDPETSHTASQLYYYRARYYETDMGRFVSRDADPYRDTMGPHTYVQGIPTLLVDPSGEFSGDYNLHHLVGEWYARYTQYGCRSQGLRILLSREFHVALERLIRPIWTAFGRGEIGQFSAYNRAMWAHVRMLPAIVRNARAAAATTGGWAVVWQGGARAAVAQLGYTSWSQAALGATGIGLVAAGAYMTYELTDRIFDALETAERVELGVTIHNIRVAGGRRIAKTLARRIRERIQAIVCCDDANQKDVDECYRAFLNRMQNRGGGLWALLFSVWPDLDRRGLTQSRRPFTSDPVVKAIWMRMSEEATKPLVECLEEAGCCPDCSALDASSE